MRISDQWIFNNSSQEIAAARTRDVAAQDQLSTGVRVVHPWDDPAAAGRAAAHQMAQDRYGGIVTEIGRGNSELTSIDGGLSDVNSALTRANELATQLSNDTYSAADRAAAAPEVQGLFASVVATLNRQVGGRYVFGGFKDGAPPFDATGNYVGDTNVRQVEIAPDVWQNVSVRADTTIKGVGGGVDVLTTLSNLSTALSTNDTTTIRASIDLLTTAISQVSTARSTVGADQATLDSASTALSAAKDDETTQLGTEVNADPFTAASNLQLADTALQASITAATKNGQQSLLDKM
jgi:flagellar hook-associated protein 3 FlgL